MFWLIYLLSAILCVWGGCLLARVIANRLELGLFRRKRRKEALEAAGAFVSGTNTPATSGMPEVKRRSGWWTLVGLGVMLFGGGVAFVHDAVSAMITNGREWRSEDIANHLMTTALLMSLGLSGGLAVVGFRFDPSLGRRRCPTCWYDMNATKGRLCPECGHEASSDRQLYRSKRSRVTIALAITSLLVYPTTTRVLYASRVGPIGLIPTTVMVLAWEWLPEKVVGTNRTVGAWRPTPSGTLADRIEGKQLWRWQRDLLDWRCQGTMHSATDIRRMYRASEVPSVGVSIDDPFIQALRPRLGALVAGVDWTDVESRIAIQWLVQSIFPAIDDKALQQDLVREIVAISPTLLTRMASPPTGWDTAEMVLLGVPGVADAIGQPWVDAFEKRLASPNMQLYHRFNCARVLAAAKPDEFTPLVLRTLASADEATGLQILRACVWHVDDPVINAKAIEMIRASNPVTAEDAVAAFILCKPIEVRNEALKRLAADQYDKASCVTPLQQAIAQGTWTPEELGTLAAGLRKTLALTDQTVVREALTVINQVPALAELLRPSLQELAKSPGTRNGAIAKTILERLPPTPQAEPEKSP